MMDDRVMSLGWALLILDNDVIQRYFEVLRYDNNGRPAELKRYDYDYGGSLNKNLFGWGEDNEEEELDTIVFNEKMGLDDNSELSWMKQNGWVGVHDFQTQRSFTPASNSWLV
jgi:hypothetical protein